ncbi:septum site-determining protein MinD [Candidatus Poribacteria bacterium]|nr:septum site-determining protein MinD [Candidatus Poribacteria bacterium]
MTSGKGGVGKTTLTANLGAALALKGKKVCVIDTDIGLRNLDIVMGLENRIVFDIVDVVEGKCRAKQALIKHKKAEGLFLLPASQTRTKESVHPDQIKSMINKLKNEEHFDYILVDSPAGIERGFENAIAGVDDALIVTTPEVSAIRDADRVIGLLQAAEIYNPKLIINRLSLDMVKRGDMMDQNDIIDVLAISIIGIVPEDENVVISSNGGELLVFNSTGSKAAAAFRKIARRIEGEEVPISPWDDDSGILARLKRIFRFATSKNEKKNGKEDEENQKEEENV